MTGPGRASRMPFGLLLVASALAVLALNAQLPGLNGPWYHQWPWRSLPAARVYGMMLAGALPSLLALWAWERGLLTPLRTLASLAGGTFLLLLAGAMVQTPDLRLTRIGDAVFHKDVTSYFLDAIDLQDEPGWLSSFPERMGSLNQHSRNKPPGGILYYTLIQHLFQRQWASAAVGGLLVGALAALGVPAVYFFARALGGSPTAGVYASACLAMCPSLLFFFPEFDQLYPALTALMLGSWALAIRRDSVAWAAACGLILAGATLFTYSFLALGTFFLAYPIERMLRGRTGLRVALRAAAVTLGLLVLCNLLLWATTGYRQVDTFFAAVHNESLLELEVKPRPYLPSLVFDPLDFALGMGYVTVLLAALHAARRAGSEFSRGAFLALLQIAVVALTGLLRTEAARIWLPLAPLLMPAAGAELERLTSRQRLLVLLGLLLVAASVVRNLELITL